MKYSIAVILLLIPLSAFAATAGTDEYLRSLGYTGAQLSTETTTEERQAFQLAEGAGRVEDPLGDVLDRFGITSTILQPYGDISRVVLEKNDDTQTWDVAVTLGGAVPDAPTNRTQIFFYADADGETTNNAPEGIRAGTDVEFCAQYDAAKDWYTDFRWYNPEADFWGVDKKTTATISIDGGEMTFHIPFAELSSSFSARWRVVIALADAAKTQIDTAPGTGFPPPKGESYPVQTTGLSGTMAWLGKLALFLAIAYGVRLWVAKKQRT
ncbi:hypothetical protein A2348_04160 [Candidatus Uhrbacteria bacterium RIFOXYB12_FULL_58_10]|uniref:Uncharacterized protein n=1 Tax=Candidatus Uhrbacteria bacterium RIFOXYB2_FULL_57_15 TaxID=1802422 RepID=A0A1F7W7U3_9BACT|nr:MAG: hypothetical protein A2348_04160 [Candidatus Uhrbacteria bacterium RIFOXYB12_FULL_58_10]OGL98850.1 MAG: hypothetical protein A2304_05165 [Candidatus Uhrbacteria bacterium RIFOXYB2_FULL_57_15]OGL98929.1 MAG: hypothetical protein A2501_02235 [Candidatus Uhrbacteria bacterium RIFOXYC12_FULL_57_11]